MKQTKKGFSVLYFDVVLPEWSSTCQSLLYASYIFKYNTNQSHLKKKKPDQKHFHETTGKSKPSLFVVNASKCLLRMEFLSTAFGCVTKHSAQVFSWVCSQQSGPARALLLRCSPDVLRASLWGRCLPEWKIWFLTVAQKVFKCLTSGSSQGKHQNLCSDVGMHQWNGMSECLD